MASGQAAGLTVQIFPLVGSCSFHTMVGGWGVLKIRSLGSDLGAAYSLLVALSTLPPSLNLSFLTRKTRCWA